MDSHFVLCFFQKWIGEHSIIFMISASIFVERYFEMFRLFLFWRKTVLNTILCIEKSIIHSIYSCKAWQIMLFTFTRKIRILSHLIAYRFIFILYQSFIDLDHIIFMNRWYFEFTNVLRAKTIDLVYMWLSHNVLVFNKYDNRGRRGHLKLLIATLWKKTIKKRFWPFTNVFCNLKE